MSLNNRRLEISVLTSSSLWGLQDLLHELTAICGVSAADLFILRDSDLLQIEKSHASKLATHSSIETSTLRKELNDYLDRRPITSIIGCDEHLPVLVKWFRDVLAKVSEIRVTALATYFPDISAHETNRRCRAIHALSNTIRLGFEIVNSDKPLIVEIVSGSVLDSCSRFSFVTHYQKKLRMLLDSLLEVVREIRSDSVFGRRDFAIAIEMEPGNGYVLNGRESIEYLTNTLLKSDQYKGLAGIVGLNADVFHYRLAGIDPIQFERYADHYVHAHVSDGPCEHTRDHPIGSWTAFEPEENEFKEYLKVLGRIRRDKGQLPWSGAVALELEGNNRSRFINSSVAALKQIISRW